MNISNTVLPVLLMFIKLIETNETNGTNEPFGTSETMRRMGRFTLAIDLPLILEYPISCLFEQVIFLPHEVGQPFLFSRPYS